MPSFHQCLSDWHRAHQAACQAEQRLARLLDLYCEGRGQAPAVEAIATVQQLRQQASSAFKRLHDCGVQPRARLPLL